MNILVTGGAGFIGSHIVDAYVELGHRVVVLDNLSSGKKERLNPDAVFYELDLLDPGVEKIFGEEKIEAVNHHAAQISVTESVADPIYDARVNILGSLHLLKYAAAAGVPKFIFASTGGAIYGEQETFPAGESHPCRPLSPYGIGKFCVENYLRFYRETLGLETVVLRYSNVYGPRQDPYGEAGVVAIFCQKFLENKPPVIFGDGEQTRDFISVFDVVRANTTVLTESILGTYNISTAKETTVNALSRHLIRLCGQDLEAQYAPPREGEQMRSVIDSRKFQQESGWVPADSLEEGLQKTFDYFSSQKV
ncbi:MAG: NAD-dependent epimerase/dehydratase family protein [Nitrospinaceae bacterium]